MVVPNRRKGVEKAIGLTLVSATALTMGAGAAPAVAGTAPTKSISTALLSSPTVDLGDGVTLTGPAIPYKDDAKNIHWYKDGGIFKLKIDLTNINKIVVTQNGTEIISEVFGVSGPDTFEKDLTLTEASDIKITISSGSVLGPDVVDPAYTDPETGLEVPEKVTPGEPTESAVTNKSFKASFDAVAPSATGEAINVGQDDGKSYVSVDTTFSVNAVDTDGVGVQSIELEKFDTVGAAWVKSRDLTNGATFTLTVSGKYRLKTIDLLGNAITHTFADVYGVSEDVVYVAPNTGRVNYNVNGAPNTGGIYKDTAKVNFIFAGAMTTSTKIKINDVWVSTEGWNFDTTDRTKTIDLAGLARAADGIYTIHAETTVFGGKKFENDFVVKADFDAPTISNATITGDYQVDGGKIYAGGGTVVTFNTDDIGSGVKTVSIEGSDAAVTTNGGQSSFTLKTGDNYTIVVTDKVGHVTRKTLTDLGLGSNSVVVDANAPVVTEVSVVAPDKTDANNKNWYIKAPVTQWTVVDDNIKSVKVTVNGLTNNVTPSAEGVYSVKLSDFAVLDGNRLDIKITAADKSKNVTELQKTIYIDADAPTNGAAAVTGTFENEPTGVYARDTLKLKATATDNQGIGIKSYQLVDSTGKVIVESATGDLDIPAGSNSLVVVDALGNKSAPVTLKDLLNLQSNNVVYDDASPVITEKDGTTPGFVDSSGNNWYTVAGDSTWTVVDANLKNVEITVNGQTKTLAPAASGEYKVNLKDYALENGNKLTISVVATDFANNIATKNLVMFIDGDAPRDLQATVDGAYQDRSFGVFAQGKLTLNSKANDGSGVGIKTYQLVDGAGKVISELKSGTTDIPQGEFLVVVVDELGNKSAPQTLQSLLGLKTNIITYDAEAPTIAVDRQAPAHRNWFGTDVDYTVKFSDNTALFSGKVSVNGKDLTDFTSTAVETSRVLKFNTSQATANADGSYDVVVNGVDAAANSVSWNETIKIDRIAPQIESFTFTTPGFKEGEALTKSNDYGFFFKEATSVDIKVNDATPSSGVKEVSYVLRNDNGTEFKKGVVAVVDNTARVDVPVGFKGYIDASATDNVLHTGEKVHPSGVITEDRNWYVNTSDIQIVVPDPGTRDNKNQFLFKGDVVATVPIKQGVSGIKTVEWGIGDTTLGNASVGIDGTLSGAGFAVDAREKNLVLSVNGQLPVNGNANNMNIWVKVVDRAGYESNANKVVSIDKDAPIIDVAYNDTVASNYYAADRTATVTITERNFNPSDVKWTGKYGTLSNWQNVGGDVWKASITFSEETEFNWGVAYTDLAGNAGKPYASETFTVDKTAPQLSVTFDNNAVQNGKFYKTARSATVEIIDRNFDPSKVTYAGDGALGGWSSNGDSHTAVVAFNKDGEYSFNVASSDKAGNASKAYDSSSFVVDMTKPSFAIAGVKNGVSYKKDVGFTVTTADTYIDTKASFVTLVGRNNGEMKVEGGFNEKTGQFEIKNFPNEKAYDDLYTLSAQVTDLAGNEVKEELLFSVNRFGSDFKFDNENLNGEYFQKLPSDIVLVQTSVDRLDMNGFSVVVLRNGEQIEVPKGSWNVKESGGDKQKWTYTITVNKDFFTEDGAYQVQMFSKAVDGTKESSMAQEYAFVIDNTKPVIYISGVEDKTVYKALEKDVTVEVRDLSGVAELAILLNDVEQPYTEENGVYKFTMPANSKSNDLFVEAKDRAGNMERAGVVEIFLTSSDIEALWHKSWVRWLVGLVGLLFAAVIALIVRGAVKRRNEDAEKQARLDAAQAASSGELYETSGALSAVNMDIPVEDAVLDISEGGESASPSPTSSGVTEDSQATNFIDEGSESTDFLDEGDGETGHFTEGK